MATYNGHKNWNHWNVALWINNDAGLYEEARRLVQHSRTKAVAAREFVAAMRANGTPCTPDYAPYTVSSVRAALRGI